jgi:hypothetical protein
MTLLATADIESLRVVVAGQVLLPGDPGYDEARTVWNGLIDRRPAVIVRCTSAADVSAALQFAAREGLEVSVRGGGHSTAGSSVVDAGLEIDLSLLRTVSVDPVAERVTVGGGATLADRDAATQAHGLAVTGGIVSHTGVGGLTLGGGMGWLTRKQGLAIDNLVQVEVVTADGTILEASAGKNAELFWAIRGGGGNFGVVTSFVFRLQRVGPMVPLGMFFWPADRTAEVLRLARNLFATMSTDVNIIIAGVNAPPEPFVPQQDHFRPCCALLIAGFGSAEEHEAVVTRVRAELPPLFELVTTLPYTGLQAMFDEANAFGFLGYDKGLYLGELDEETIDVVARQLPLKNSPRSTLFLYRLDGAYSEVDDQETAFSGGRSPRYCAFIIAYADNPEMLVADQQWVRGFWDELSAHALGAGGYINGDSEFPYERVRSSYGPVKYDRLTSLDSSSTRWRRQVSRYR